MNICFYAGQEGLVLNNSPDLQLLKMTRIYFLAMLHIHQGLAGVSSL